MPEKFGDKLFNDKCAQVGAATTAVGAVGTSSTIVNAAGLLVGTKAGVVLSNIALAIGASPVYLVAGGVLLIGIGVFRAIRKEE